MEYEVLDYISRTESKSVKELSSLTGLTKREVQSELEELMEQGRITSTPDWEYRISRRSD